MLKNILKKTVAVIILLSMLFTNNGLLVYANSSSEKTNDINVEEESEFREVILDKFIDDLSINAKEITKIEFKKGAEGEVIKDGIRAEIDGKDVYINIEKDVTAKLPKDSSKYFYGLTNLTEINGLELLDASSVENMASMFEGNKKLKKIDISSFNPNNLLKTTDMFRDNAELRYINIENLDTSKTTDMVGMFNICPKLTEIVGIENMDTSSAKSLDWMFYDDRELVELDLSNWTVSSEISMNQCFTRCSNLETVYISDMWDESRRRVGNATDGTTNLTKIKFVDGEDKDNDKDTDTDNIKVDKSPAEKNESVEKENIDESITIKDDDEEPEKDVVKETEKETEADVVETRFVELDNFFDKLSINKKLIEKLEFVVGNDGDIVLADGIKANVDGKNVYINIEKDVTAKLPKDSSKYFYELKSLTGIKGLNLLDATAVENMTKMFEGNSKLKRIDISNFQPNNLLKTTDMFRDNAELRYINIENLDTSKTTDMVGMFNICPKLTKIVGIENMDTGSAKSLDWMFYDDKNLKELDLTNWTVNKNISMNQCFTNCNSLESIYVSDKWDDSREDRRIKRGTKDELTQLYFSLNGGNTREVVLDDFLDRLDIERYEIKKLEFRRGTGGIELESGISAKVEGTTVYINIENGVSAKLPEDATGYFSEMEKVTEIKGLELLDGSDVTSTREMFSYCYELKSIDISNFRPNNLLDTSNMFYVCSELTYVNMKNLDTSKVTNMREMFAGCSKLTKIDGIQGMKTDSTNNLSQMFYGAQSLVELNLTNWTVTSSTNLRNCFNNCRSLEKVYVSNKWDSSRRKVGNSTDGTPNLTKLQFIEKEIEEDEIETEQTEIETSEIAPTETEPSEIETSETAPTETEPSETETSETAPIETEPSETETSETTPIETEPSETETSETAPIETEPSETETSETTPIETEPSETETSETTPIETETSETETSEIETQPGGEVVDEELQKVVLDKFTSKLEGIKKSKIEKLEFKKGTEGIELIDGVSYKIDGKSVYINIKEGVKVKLPSNSARYFEGMEDVVEIKGLELLDATDVEDMSDMFSFCYKLKSIDISSFKPKNLLYTKNMFSYCFGLTYINMKNLDTSKVLDFRAMFYLCPKLTQIDGIEEMKTNSTVLMYSVFYNNKSLVEVDLSNWTVTDGTGLDGCFYGCEKLEKIYVSSKWINDRRRVNNEIDGTDNLTKLNFINKETGEIENYKPYSKEIVLNKFIENLSVKYDEIEKLEFKQGTDGKEIVRGVYEKVDGKSVVINIKSGFTVKLPVDSTEYFKGMSKVEEIKGFELLDTTDVANMSGMFASCSSLKTIDVSSFKPSNLLNTEYMFYDCAELLIIDITNINTSKVTKMNYMFAECPKLFKIKGTYAMRTDSASSLTSIFYKDASLTDLDLISWIVNPEITLENCFALCNNLSRVYISDGWNENRRKSNNATNGTDGLKEIRFVDQKGILWGAETTIITTSMLYERLGVAKTSITKINFTKTEPVKGHCIVIAPYLFAYVNGTEVSYYVERDDIFMPEDASNMFSGLSALKEITGLKIINCSNLKNMQGMFKGNSELTKIDFGNVDFSNVSNIEELFSGDSKLNTLSNLNIQTLKNAVKGNVFKGINNLNFIKNNRKLLSKDESIVELDLNGGKFSGNGTTFYIKGNEEYNLPQNVVRDGYILNGWECDLDKKNYRSIGSKYHKDVKFKAVWEQKISQKTIKYVSEIVAEWGYDKETVKGQLEKKGYSVINFDLNDGSYKDGKQAPYIYIGVKTTTNRDKAITDIIADVKDSRSDKGSRTMERNVRGKGKCKYYGVKRLSDSNKLVDFNETAGGKWIYLFYTKDKSDETHSELSPLTGIKIGGIQFDANSAIGYKLNHNWSGNVIEEEKKYKVNMNYDSKDKDKNKSGKEDPNGVYITFENLYYLKKIIEKADNDLENKKFGKNIEEYYKLPKLGDLSGGYYVATTDKKSDFIKDIKMVAEKKSTAESIFKSKGYTMIPQNLNSGTNAKEIYLGYTTTNKKSEAITSIGEVSASRPYQNTMEYTGSYHKYTYASVRDFNDISWNTNEGKANSFVYVYTTKSASAGKGDVITEFEVLNFTKAQSISSLQENGKWIVVTNIDNNGLSNFNKNGGDYIYIRYKNTGLDAYNPVVYEENEEAVNEEKPKKLLKSNDLTNEEYIKDIKMVVADKKTAEETFENNGYVMMATNLNNKTNGKEIYIGYTTTNNKTEAITSIGERWFNAAGRNPQNYTGSYHKNYYTAVTDFSGKQWNTNEGGNSAARWVYLYASKDSKAGEPIKTMEVLNFTKEQTINTLEQNNTWTVVTNSNDNGLSDFNRGAGGDRIYIRYKK